MFEDIRTDPERQLLLTHEDGVTLQPGIAGRFPNQRAHDPADLHAAREIAAADGAVPLGLLYRNPDCPRYDQITAQGLDMTPQERVAAVERELDRFAI